MWRTWHLSAGLALALLVLWVGLWAYQQVEPDAYGATRIDEAVDLDAASSFKLPVDWMGPFSVAAQRRFELRFEVTATGKAPLFLYFPRYEQSIKVALNGVPVESAGLHQNWQGLRHFNSAIVAVPPGRIQLGKNVLAVTLFTGPLPRGSLSPVYLGEWEKLAGIYHLRNLVEHDVRWLTLGVLLVLFLTSLTLYRFIPDERIYIWIAISMGFPLIFRMGMFAQIFPSAPIWSAYAFLLV